MPNVERQKFGVLIKRLRDSRLLTQRQLGISSRAAVNLEAGTVVPQLTTLQDVMDAMTLTADERREVLEQFRRAEVERDKHGPISGGGGGGAGGLKIEGRIAGAIAAAGEEDEVTVTLPRYVAEELIKALRISARKPHTGRKPMKKAAKRKLIE